MKFYLVILSVACLLITGCRVFSTKSDIVDFDIREIDRIEIYKRYLGNLGNTISYPPLVKYDRNVLHFIAIDSGKYDDLSDALSKLIPSDGMVTDLWLYCEIHFLDGSIKGIELHPGGYVKFEGKSYKDSSETISAVIESMIQSHTLDIKGGK